MALKRGARTRVRSANPMIAPLSRNRNYQLLWGSLAFSEFGGSAAGIALPLLVLAMTHSPAMVGLVLATSATASLLAGLPAGALVDRWNHKKVMLGCWVTGLIAYVTLVVALWRDMASIGHLIFVVIIGGVCGAMFGSAEQACLPNLVPNEHLSRAVSMNAARGHLAALAGTTVGGFLFAISKFVPYAMDVLTQIIGLFMLLFVRVPPREIQPEPLSRLGHEIAFGLRWILSHRPLRVMGLVAVGLNMFSAAYFVIIIVLAQARGVPPGQIGIMAGIAGVGGILGCFIAPYLYQRLSSYLSIIAVFWVMTFLAPLVIFIRNGYLMGILFAAMAFLAPTANTAVGTYQLLLTPDGLRGRMTSVMAVVIGCAGIAGPALGGFLMEAFTYNEAILLCAAGVGVVTVLSTISPTLRGFPRSTAIEAHEATAQEHKPAVG